MSSSIKIQSVYLASDFGVVFDNNLDYLNLQMHKESLESKLPGIVDSQEYWFFQLKQPNVQPAIKIKFVQKDRQSSAFGGFALPSFDHSPQ